MYSLSLSEIYLILSGHSLTFLLLYACQQVSQYFYVIFSLFSCSYRFIEMLIFYCVYFKHTQIH